MDSKADPTFLALFTITFIAAALSGSTLQWVIARGLFTKGFRNKRNEYNIIVFVAAASSMSLTMFNFISYHAVPPQMAYSVFLVLNWIVSTHSSIMLVSRRLSMTYMNPEKVYKRLLLINVAMAPVSIMVFVVWAGTHQTDIEMYAKINKILEPTQIALWGAIEFVLSGIFIVKMWKFQWTKVERRGILALVLVGCCDVISVISFLIVGDRASTVVKACVYCLRIRLEVGVLVTMSNFLKEKRDAVMYSSGSSTSPYSFLSRPFGKFGSGPLKQSSGTSGAENKSVEESADFVPVDATNPAELGPVVDPSGAVSAV